MKKDFEIKMTAKDVSNKAKKTMVAKGWHPNYSEFSKDGINGCVTYVGSKMIVEVGEHHRFEIDLSDVIELAIERTKPIIDVGDI